MPSSKVDSLSSVEPPVVRDAPEPTYTETVTPTPPSVPVIDAKAAKKAALIEGLKEFGRLVLIAAVSAALAAALASVGLVKDPTLRLAVTTFLTFVIKAWDKKIHTDPTTDSKGLTGF